MRLIFLGPPGAGKGTQSEIICDEFGIVQLSTGDLLRSNIKDDTEIGRKAKAFMNTGQLVPDNIIMDMISVELVKPDYEKGYILDGFPRTVNQAEKLDLILKNLDQKLDSVLVLDVPLDSLVERLTARRTCKVCGKIYHMVFNPPKFNESCDNDGSKLYQRPDDTKETVMNRLDVYQLQTQPLIDYYKQKKLAHIIDGSKKIDDVSSDILRYLHSIKRLITAY